MNRKTHYIDKGKEFIQVLLLRQVRHDIEVKTSDGISNDLKESLLVKWEEGKVFPSQDTQMRLLKTLQTSPESLSNLKSELHSLKEKIDIEEDMNTSRTISPLRLERNLSFGSYFFISAVIALVDLSILTVKEKKVEKELLKKLYPLVESAKRFSKELRVRPPNITEHALMHQNVDAIQRSLKRWTSLLIQSAMSEPISENRPKLVFRGLIKGIPYVGNAIDALIFGK